MTEPVFASVESALTFAFRYAGQQSPPTPMRRLGTEANLGSGRGLVGLDGAAQAGLILRELDKLPKPQRWVLTVRFGDVRRECPCCGQPAPSAEWLDAVDGLCWCEELEGYPRRVKYAMIEKIVCRRPVVLKALWVDHGLVPRTGHRHMGLLKDRLTGAERDGLNSLGDVFKSTGLVGEM